MAGLKKKAKAVPSKDQGTGYLYQRMVLEESGEGEYTPKFLAC